MNLRLRSPETLIRAIAVISLVYCLISFNAFPGDSLMYHIPFAARFWQPPGWPDYSGYLEGRYQGFPILWRIFMLPGMLFKAPRLLFLPNLLGMLLLCWSARRYLLLPWHLCLVACLCFPVVLFGFASSMQDFFVGATAVAGAIALFAASLLRDAESKRAWLAGLLFLALSSNVKHQGLILSAIILALSLGFTLAAKLADPDKRRQPLQLKRDRNLGSFSILATLLAILLFIQPLANLIRFNNPLYPNNVFIFKGSEPTGVSTLPYIPQIPIAYNALSFFSSALEIDPILRSSRRFLFQRTVHMQNPPDSMTQPADPLGNRWIITGGSYGVLYLLLMSIAVLSSIRSYRQRSTLAARNSTQEVSKKCLQNRLMISLVATILLPQSLELRYYMYNLIVPALVAVSSPWPDLRQISRLLASATILGTLATSLLLPVYFWSRTGSWLHSRISWDPLYAAPSAQQCREIDDQIARISEDQNLRIGTVQESVVCHFQR